MGLGVGLSLLRRPQGPAGPAGSAAPGGRRVASVSVGSDVNLSVLGKRFTECLGHPTSGVEIPHLPEVKRI